MSTPGGLNTLLLASAAEAAAGYEIERSLRFNSSDTAYLSRTPASAGNRKTWTWAGWVKKVKVSPSDESCLFGDTNQSYDCFRFRTTDVFEIFWYDGGNNSKRTTAVFRDASAWYHIVVKSDTTQASEPDRVKLYINGIEQTAFATNDSIAQDYEWRFNNNTAISIGRRGTSGSAADYLDGYLADIHFIDGQALDPTSFGEFDANGIWQPKAYTGSYGTNGFHLDFSDNSSAAALGYDAAGSNDWTVNNISPGSLVDYTTNIDLVNGDPIRSTDNIYDIFDGNTSTGAETNDGTGNSLLFDFANGTGSIPVSSNIQVWVGGSDGRTLKVNGSVIATNTGVGNNPHTITGQSQLDSVEVVSEVSSRSGFLLQIAVDGTALVSFPGKDNDSLVDVPTNGTETDTGAGGEVRGNYCTLNPLKIGANATLTNGNLDFTSSTTAGFNIALGTIGVSSGKWYWEVTATSSLGNGLGIATDKVNINDYLGGDANGWMYYQNTGEKYNNNTAASYGSSYTTNDVIGFAFDADAGSITAYKNGVSQGVMYSGLAADTYFPAVSDSSNSTGPTSVANFGQRPFAYTAPSGFKALCTTNLPAPTIEDGSTAMDVVTYTGNGSTQTISGLNFSPDFVWVKNRSTNNGSRLADTVRGVTKFLISNNANAEDTSAQALQSFTADGFTVGSNQGYNTNSDSYVAWNWDGGSSTVTNTDGSITSTVRANASAGISIISYTGNGTSGATVGHGLNVAPSFYICKFRNTNASNGPWYVYHKSLGATKGLTLNTTDAESTLSSLWNDTEPTSTVFSLGNAGDTNGSGRNFISYAFAPVSGFSAFGSYIGNGNADGPFVYTGFRPAFVLVKMSSSTGDWTILDSIREGYNVDNDPLYANLNNAEGTADLVDITSNGFKVRTTDATFNTNAGTYVYAAFAENPFQYARAR